MVKFCSNSSLLLEYGCMTLGRRKNSAGTKEAEIRIQVFKGVLNPNFRLFSFEFKKIRLFEIYFDQGFRVL